MTKYAGAQIKNFYLLLVPVCVVSEKIQGLAGVSAVDNKNKTAMSHLQLI
jgi:hypothetical protein